MDRVTRALKTLNYTEIARKTGTTVGYVSLLFRGKRRAKMETMGKIATAVGVSVEDLHNHLMRVFREPGGKLDGKGGKRPKAPTAAAA